MENERHSGFLHEEQGLQTLLDQLPKLHLGVLGDFCLDVYWILDPACTEVSLETGLRIQAVQKQEICLGGAGNVVKNLLAMQVGQVSIFGVGGDDLFGRELQYMLDRPSIHQAGWRTQSSQWDTPVYVKPIINREEGSRLDLGCRNRLESTVATQVLDELEKALPRLNAVIINQQWSSGLHSPFFHQRLNNIIQQHPESIFLADFRDSRICYPSCAWKLNEREAMKLLGWKWDPDECVPINTIRQGADILFQQRHAPLFITRGEKGCVVRDKHGFQNVPGLHIVRPTDPVGAGGSPHEAAVFGNFVAGVTVQKRLQTGVASPSEILAIGSHPDYIKQADVDSQDTAV